MERSAAALRAVTISGSAAIFLWEDVVWLGHQPEDQPGLDCLRERLVAVMQAEPGGATMTASS
jgi:hypothetical protein